jgi:hypothetical protein
VCCCECSFKCEEECSKDSPAGLHVLPLLACFEDQCGACRASSMWSSAVGKLLQPIQPIKVKHTIEWVVQTAQ